MHTRTVIFSCVEMESFCVFLPLCDIFHHPLLDYMASIIHVTLFPPGTRVAIPMGLRQMRWCPLKQHGSVPTGRPASQVIKEVKGSVIFHPTIQFSILSALYLQLSITFISLPLSPTMTLQPIVQRPSQDSSSSQEFPSSLSSGRFPVAWIPCFPSFGLCPHFSELWSPVVKIFFLAEEQTYSKVY